MPALDKYVQCTHLYPHDHGNILFSLFVIFIHVAKDYAVSHLLLLVQLGVAVLLMITEYAVSRNDHDAACLLMCVRVNACTCCIVNSECLYAEMSCYQQHCKPSVWPKWSDL